jgi:hypothetical protein
VVDHAVTDFKYQYNKYWTRYHLVARYLACPDISTDSKAQNTHKLNEAEQQLGELIGTAEEFIGRKMTTEEIEFGFHDGRWKLDV